jgi:alpha-glucosidase
MMLNFHGSTKPGGENRTWPWVVTSEAVAGTEHYLYPPPTTARQDVTYPFIRNMLGGMDYTPTMISENASILTQGHTLAQAVVFTSAMVNYADSAAVYEQWDGRQLMRVLPTTWDETKVVEGFPGDHVTVARRSGDDWFVGAMTSPARTARCPCRSPAPTPRRSSPRDGDRRASPEFRRKHHPDQERVRGNRDGRLP